MHGRISGVIRITCKQMSHVDFLIFYYVCAKTSRMIAIRINIRRNPFATQKSQSKKCLSRYSVVMRMAFSTQTVCRTVKLELIPVGIFEISSAFLFKYLKENAVKADSQD